MARFKTINDIVNQVAVETGLNSVANVFSAADPAFTQLTTLANACAVELQQNETWQGFHAEHAITTSSTDSGKYPLPDDFMYMLNQTGWDQTNNVPLGGPLSPQDWQYLEGRDLVSQTIYASFRLAEREFWIFPQPPPDGLEIRFEYASRNWVDKAGSGMLGDSVTQVSDVVLFEPYLFERVLKTRFLQARGFDTTAAQGEYTAALVAWGGKDKAAPILNAGRYRSGVPYLDGFRNLPDTGYGS